MSIEQKAPDKETLEKAFKGNSDLLLSIRALLFGKETTKEERDNLKKTFDDELIRVFRKRMMGEALKTTPIGQYQNFWNSTEKQIMGAPEHTIKQVVEAKKIAKTYLEQSIELLKDPEGEPIKSEILSLEDDPLQSSLIAKNLFEGTVENTLAMIDVVVNKEDMTEEEIKEKVLQDSAE